ncbi:unnamed protein product (mitochondrion) [Plasmodiophora brassicae]|uniref:ABC transporter domain-containing protein n=1 Tax=Plasmodiophora brassicae TaxID=37360 RepID=A0A3P3YG38_PLABS|nr:unnamed protein product [Plasmodiophora brassicae]
MGWACHVRVLTARHVRARRLVAPVVFCLSMALLIKLMSTVVEVDPSALPSHRPVSLDLRQVVDNRGSSYMRVTPDDSRTQHYRELLEAAVSGTGTTVVSGDQATPDGSALLAIVEFDWTEWPTVRYTVKIPDGPDHRWRDTLMAAIQATLNGVSPTPVLVHLQSIPRRVDLDSFGWILVICLLFTGSSQLAILVAEKDARVREGLKIMGVSESAWMASHIIASAIPYALLLPVVILYFPSVFPSKMVLQVILTFFLFIVTLFALAYMVSAFFTRSKLASFCFSLGTIAVTVLLWNTVRYREVGLQLAGSLFSPVAFLSTLSTFLRQRSLDSYLSSRRVTEPVPELVAAIPFGYGIVMLLIDIVIYLGLGLYFHEVLPKKYGPRRPWNFIFRWRSTTPASEEFQPLIEGARVEKAAPGMTPGIAIRNLQLKYNRGAVVAVDDLSVDMFSGQVFALLGPNGAGKTSTLDCLTGIREPSDGQIIVNGKNAITDMAAIRESLGVCPQYDVLYDDMTVSKHIEFFGRLKGLSSQEAQVEAQRLMGALELTHKANTVAKVLSGGEKRKLSVAIAFVGNPSVVILDEPSAGLDAESRQRLWDLIKSLRQDRCIILTTHQMSEAEALGDRIGIMASGRLVCCGSALYLKHRYNIGYQLTTTFAGNASAADRAALHALVLSHIPGSSVMTSSGVQATFCLPLAYRHNFPAFLRALDDVDGVSSYGLSLATMEQVFLRVVNEETTPTTTTSTQAGVEYVDAEMSKAGKVSRSRLGRFVPPLLFIRLAHTLRDFQLWFSMFSGLVVLSLYILLGNSTDPRRVVAGRVTPASAMFVPIRQTVYIQSSAHLSQIDYANIEVLPSGLSPGALEQRTALALMTDPGMLGVICKTGSSLVFTSWGGLAQLALGQVWSDLNGFHSRPSVSLLATEYSAHQHTWAGLSVVQYWLIAFIVNFVCVFVPLAIGVALFKLGLGVSSVPSTGALFAVIAPYAAASTVLVSCVSLWATSDASISTRLQVFQVVTGPVLFVVEFGAKAVMLRDPTSSLAPLPYLNVLPSMALLKSLIGAYVTDAAPKDLLPQLPNWIVHAQRDGLLGMMTVVLAGAACILFVESVRWYPSIRRRVTLGKAPLLSLGPSDSSALVSVQNLSKAYTKSKLAVDSISFSVRAGECFGHLGTNGAGKTTTMRCMTGEERPTDGDVFVAGESCAEQTSRARSNLSYGPQEDALISGLNAFDHLWAYGRIMGVSNSDLDEIVPELIQRVGLGKFAKRPAGTYSGGNRRKLSSAIALMGNRRVILLDEPTAGIDPSSRRLIWNLVREACGKPDRCVVLTTHMLEEAEALCSRISIMVNGTIRCMGTAQQLKDAFGAFYHIQVIAKAPGPLDPIKSGLRERFPGLSITDEVGLLLRASVPRTPHCRLPDVFERLESMSDALDEYAVEETSLEQIFVSLAHQPAHMERVVVATA